jgi:hypothetical protein
MGRAPATGYRLARTCCCTASCPLDTRRCRSGRLCHSQPGSRHPCSTECWQCRLRGILAYQSDRRRCRSGRSCHSQPGSRRQYNTARLEYSSGHTASAHQGSYFDRHRSHTRLSSHRSRRCRRARRSHSWPGRSADQRTRRCSRQADRTGRHRRHSGRSSDSQPGSRRPCSRQCWRYRRRGSLDDRLGRRRRRSGKSSRSRSGSRYRCSIVRRECRPLDRRADRSGSRSCSLYSARDQTGTEARNDRHTAPTSRSPRAARTRNRDRFRGPRPRYTRRVCWTRTRWRTSVHSRRCQRSAQERLVSLAPDEAGRWLAPGQPGPRRVGGQPAAGRDHLPTLERDHRASSALDCSHALEGVTARIETRSRNCNGFVRYASVSQTTLPVK